VILSVRKNQLHELERGPYHEVSTSTATPRQGCLPLCALRALLGAGGIWRLNSPDFGHRKESTGAVVPAARVTAVETQTGIKQTTRTNTQGFYSFRRFRWPLGLEVRANCFKEYKQTGMTLDVRKALLVDVPLELRSSRPRENSIVFFPERVVSQEANFWDHGIGQPKG